MAETQKLRQPLISTTPGVARILKGLRGAGHEAYLVGGCVRDALMGRAPKDYDIATSATPDEVEALFSKTVPVGKSFGVMIVVENGENHEVATFRADLPYADGRRPEGVTFTSAEEDVRRRDFTCNGLLYDPDTDRVLDYVGGRDDIARGLLRTVGDPRERFLEDHLRLLRAVRFAARTGFEIESETLRVMGEVAGLVRTVSGERRGEELRRMLTEGTSRASFDLLALSGLLRHVLPEMDATRGMPQPEEFHPEGDVWQHTLIMLGLMDETYAANDALGESSASQWQGTRREIFAWAVLLHDVGKPPTLSVDRRIRFNEHDKIGAQMAEEILQRLKRPRAIVDGVTELIGRHMHFIDLEKMRPAKLRRFLQEPLFRLHLELHRLDCAASHGMMQGYAYGLAAWQEEQARPPEVEPLLTGRDLLEAGYAPGPEMGEILSAVQDARLEGEITSREEALGWVHERYPANG